MTYSIKINFVIFSIFCNLHRLYKSVMFLFKQLNSAIYPKNVNYITNELQILPGIFKYTLPETGTNFFNYNTTNSEPTLY